MKNKNTLAWFNMIANGTHCSAIATQYRCSKNHVRNTVIEYFQRKHPKLADSVFKHNQTAWPGYLEMIREFRSKGLL